MPMFQITVIPITGKSNVSVSKYIAEIIDYLKDNGIEYTLTPTATIINCNNIKECFSLMYKIHNFLFKKYNLPRIITNIMIDDRRDKSVKPQDKINSVKQKLK